MRFKMNKGNSDVRNIKSEERQLFLSQQNRMDKESRELDSAKYFGKVHNLDARKMISSQNEMISSMVSRPEKTMIKIEYFDTLLNLERKMEHFLKLFTKIKLRVIHKPFIILDMLKIMTEDRSGVSIFVSLVKKLLNMRKRDGVDAVIDFVEHKKELINRWARLAGALSRRRKQLTLGAIEQEQIAKHKRRTRLQKNRRGLRYLGTILNNFFREYKRSVWVGFVRKAFAEEPKWKSKEVSLDITNQQGFLRGKEKKSGPVGSSEGAYAKAKDEESSYNNHTFEVRGNQMNTYFDTNGKQKGSEYNSGDDDKDKEKKRDFESSFEEPEERTLEQVQVALVKGGVDSGKLLGQIRSEIEKIQGRLDKDEKNEKRLKFKDKIDMLTQLTNLLQMIKKYYEGLKDKAEDKKVDREDFEQVLQILQRVIARLLQKIPTDIGDLGHLKSQRSSRVNGETGSLEDERARFDSHRLQAEMGKNLNKEMESLVNLIEPKTDLKRRMGEEADYETEPAADNEYREGDENLEKMQSVSGINGLLEEMMQNLNVMNENIDNNKAQDFVEMSKPDQTRPTRPTATSTSRPATAT